MAQSVISLSCLSLTADVGLELRQVHLQLITNVWKKTVFKEHKTDTLYPALNWRRRRSRDHLPCIGSLRELRKLLGRHEIMYHLLNNVVPVTRIKKNRIFARSLTNTRAPHPCDFASFQIPRREGEEHWT